MAARPEVRVQGKQSMGAGQAVYGLKWKCFCTWQGGAGVGRFAGRALEGVLAMPD